MEGVVGEVGVGEERCVGDSDIGEPVTVSNATMKRDTPA